MTVFTRDQQIAIAELVKFAEMLGESSNPVTLSIAGLACERAANIIENEAHPLFFSDEEIMRFYETWKLNPPRGES